MSYKDEQYIPSEIYGLSDGRPFLAAPGGFGYIMQAHLEGGRTFNIYSAYDIRYLAVLPDLSATLIIERSEKIDEPLFTNITNSLVLSGLRKAGKRYPSANWELGEIQAGDEVRLTSRKNTPPLRSVVQSIWFTG